MWSMVKFKLCIVCLTIRDERKIPSQSCQTLGNIELEGQIFIVFVRGGARGEVCCLGSPRWILNANNV